VSSTFGLCGREGALRAERAAVEVSGPQNGGPIVEPRNVPCAWARPKPEAWGHAQRAGAPTGRAPDLGNPGFSHQALGWSNPRVAARFTTVARGARARRHVLLMAASRGRRIVTLGTTGGVEGVFRGRGSLSSSTLFRPIPCRVKRRAPTTESVRTIAERLCGASASAAKAAAAATQHQVQRGLFVDASIGFPLGV